MHKNPNQRKTFGYNSNKAWYIAPYFNHYQTLKGILPLTGSERMSYMVRFKNHDITIPKLAPAKIILEAVMQGDDEIKKQPKRAPMEKLTAIELLQEVLLGDKKEKLPPNSVQIKNTKQKEMVPEDDTSEPINPTQTVPENATIESIPNDTDYVTHD